MKALVVEDNPTSRRLMRGLLERVFGYEVSEAVDGLEGLEQVHQNPPDVVLLDVLMPKLDGIEVLKGLRASKRFADMPVIAVSSVSERQTVLEMIELGITDYILKAMNIDAVRARLSKALSGIEMRTQCTDAVTGQKSAPRTLLVLEKDVNFQSFVSTLFGTEFEVEIVDDPFAALQIVSENLGIVALVGDDLELLQAPAFARIVRDGPNGADTQLILVSAGGEPSEDDTENFDSVIRKSFVPETFSADLRRALAARNGRLDLETLLKGELRAELITAAQQAVGVLANQEAEPLPAAHQIEQDVRCQVKLCDPNSESAVVLCLGGAEEDVVSLASCILGESVGLEDGARDALSEVANTVAGRLRQSLWDRGVTLEQQSPEVASVPVGFDPISGMAVAFQLASGERFVLEVGVGD